MTITEIRIRRTYSTGRLRAVVSVVLDGCVAVHELKVIQGDDRLFVAMPCRTELDGSHRDIIHPIGEISRKALETAVLGAYRNCVADYRLCAE